MSDLPKHIEIREEGPREGFQYEPGPIATERKIELIDRLSDTGLREIQIVSFVNPKAVPGMADAEAVVAGITRRPGVHYLGLWLNEKGMERAVATGKLDIKGSILFSASERFTLRNQNRTLVEHERAQHEMARRYKELGVPIDYALITAAFGCNFEGDVAASKVVEIVGTILALCEEQEIDLSYISLADTMGWATPLQVKRLVGAVRDRYPDAPLSLHLHDTRGMGIANAFAGLEMGVAHFDASAAGLGGCPFAGNRAAAGNVCTEDLVFLCDEIETGVDLKALVDCAILAEEVVGHPLPGSIKSGGTLRTLRQKIAAGARA